MSPAKTIASKVPKLRFREFHEEWEENILWNISDVRDGTHDSPKYISNSPYWLITSKNLTNDGKLDLSDINYISEADYFKINKRSWVNIGDILFGMIGTIGNPVLLKQEWFSIKNVALIKEKKWFYNTFLIQYLKGKSIKKQFQEKNAGWTQKFLSLSVIRNLSIISPSFHEQSKIASFLSTVDEKIEKLKTKKSLLEKYKKWVMQRIFAREIRFKDENGKEFGEWEEKKLGEVAKFSKGKWISKADIDENGVVECIRYGELYTTYRETISVIKSKTNLDVQDLVLSEANDVIIPASWETEIDIATASCVLLSGIALGWDLNILKTKLNGVFLSYYLNNAKKKEIANLAQWIAVVHLYSSQLQNLGIEIPSFPEQQKIASFLSEIDKKIESIGWEIEQAEKWKKGLLQGMFI